jgi:hypothetical protein
VTFNGNTFDLPVLGYCAMIHGISAPGLAALLYFNRYTEDAVDLCDILSSFAPHTKASLNELSKIMGLLGKPEGIEPSLAELRCLSPQRFGNEIANLFQRLGYEVHQTPYSNDFGRDAILTKLGMSIAWAAA